MAAPHAPPPPPPALFRSPPIARPRQHSGPVGDPGSTRRRNIGEVAGGATADVAVVACCFPCAVMELAVLAVYKVPAGMCRKAWRKNRRLRMERRRRAMSMPEDGYRRLGLAAALDEDDGDLSLMRRMNGGDAEVDDTSWGGSADADSDGWNQFYVNGFWRGDDRDDDDDHHHHLHLHH